MYDTSLSQMMASAVSEAHVLRAFFLTLHARVLLPQYSVTN